MRVSTDGAKICRIGQWCRRPNRRQFCGIMYYIYTYISWLLWSLDHNYNLRQGPWILRNYFEEKPERIFSRCRTRPTLTLSHTLTHPTPPNFSPPPPTTPDAPPSHPITTLTSIITVMFTTTNNELTFSSIATVTSSLSQPPSASSLSQNCHSHMTYFNAIVCARFLIM